MEEGGREFDADSWEDDVATDDDDIIEVDG